VFVFLHSIAPQKISVVPQIRRRGNIETQRDQTALFIQQRIPVDEQNYTERRPQKMKQFVTKQR